MKQSGEIALAYNEVLIYTIQRKNPNTGHTETITYTGDIRQKPKGWKVIKKAYYAPLTINGLSGLI